MSKHKKWIILAAFLWFSLLGVLLHFTYDWSGQNAFVGLFSAVNESTWEHLKLLFFPSAAFAVVSWFFLRKSCPSVLTAFFFATFCGMLTIVTLFYTYSGILGTFYSFINIAIFFLGAGVTACLGVRWCFQWNTAGNLWGLALFTLTAILFFRFTANPPDLGIFRSLA